VRRECLDHVIVLNERHLKEIISCYLDYYHRWRTHLSLAMDPPGGRAAQPPILGKVVAFQEVGGLHHHYERLAAGPRVTGESESLVRWCATDFRERQVPLDGGVRNTCALEADSTFAGRGAEVVHTTGGHHFDGDCLGLARRILFGFKARAQRLAR
jgi:hypothetical protein